MSTLRTVRLLVLLALIALAAYAAYSRWIWEPNRQTKEAIRQAVGQADGVSADQSRDETQPLLDRARKERKIRIADLRESVLPAAKRAGELKSLHDEAMNVAEGRPLPPEERVVPPPPPPPVIPLHARLPVSLRTAEPFVDSGSSFFWHSFSPKVLLYGPLYVRARGSVTKVDLKSGPDGTSEWKRPRYANKGKPMPGVPSLALIARVCQVTDRIKERTSLSDGTLTETNQVCGAPFFVGSEAIICPDRVGGTGELQFGINDYMDTPAGTSSDNVGGYSLSIAETSSSACKSGSTADLAKEAAAIADGLTTRTAENRVLVTQIGWKAFALPQGAAYEITATGHTQDQAGAEVSGPNGINPSRRIPWPFVDDRFPYRALLGRLCRGLKCSEPFLVGSRRVVCRDIFPSADTLELQINNYNPKVLGELQSYLYGARGAYRFDIQPASAEGCR